MNNYNPYGNQFQQPAQPQQQTAGTPLMVTLLPDISAADTAKNMLGDPNVQTPAQALEKLYQSGRIDRAAYEMFKGMM